jgi:alpha-glucosidase (family GH31 glycosyl hydrolase)
MDGAGDWVQYMFGPDVLFAPVVQPAGSSPLANKTAWLPPGVWYDANTGVVTNAGTTVGVNVTKGFALAEIPMW